MSAPQPTYRITRWSELFECNRTREVRRLEWIAYTLELDSDGYAELMASPDGPAIYGVRTGLLQVAARATPRGTLVRDGGRPHTVESLAHLLRIPVELVQNAISRLLELGWLEIVRANKHSQIKKILSQPAAGLPQEPAPSRARATERETDLPTDQHNREGEGERTAPARALSIVDFSGKDARNFANELIDELIPAHWCTSNRRDALGQAERIFATATSPESQYEAIVANHARWRQYLAANPKERKQRLEFWLGDGNYLDPPPAIDSKLPVSATGW